jgi:hypothetical protein
MDPYLEDAKIWPAFQHQLATRLYHILSPSVVDRYQLRVGQRRYVTEVPLFTSVIREEHTEKFIEVRPRGDSRLITLIDVVSPANKTSPAGRDAYLDTRRAAKAAGANLVEIDLVLQGAPTLDYSRDGLPDWDYAVTVNRATKPESFEIYTATLQKRLPKFRLPLVRDDHDVTLDLQNGFTRVYDDGYAQLIDYATDPPVPLTDTDRSWLHELLRQQKLR